jgi:Lon protease-like protein
MRNTIDLKGIAIQHDRIIYTIMNQIPLFPLHSVLFPGMPIRLQVFENRYLEMVQTCVDQNMPFGVVLIKDGMEALGPLPIPHEIGCLTTIQQLQPLEDGRVNLVGQGVERIEILEVSREAPYLQATIQQWPLHGEDHPDAVRLANQVRPLLAHYLVELAASRNQTIDPPDLPGNPNRLAYLTCSLLHIPADEKQTLLSEKETRQLLNRLLEALKLEIPLLRTLRTRKRPQSIGSFGLN